VGIHAGGDDSACQWWGGSSPSRLRFYRLEDLILGQRIGPALNSVSGCAIRGSLTNLIIPAPPGLGCGRSMTSSCRGVIAPLSLIVSLDHRASRCFPWGSNMAPAPFDISTGALLLCGPEQRSAIRRWQLFSCSAMMFRCLYGSNSIASMRRLGRIVMFLVVGGRARSVVSTTLAGLPRWGALCRLSRLHCLPCCLVSIFSTVLFTSSQSSASRCASRAVLFASRCASRAVCFYFALISISILSPVWIE
jgi:hypothetical protein